MNGRKTEPQKPGVGRVVVEALIPALLAILFLRAGRGVMAAILGATVVVTLGSGLLFPALYRTLDRWRRKLGTAVATGLTWVLLTLLFLLVFTPGRLVLRLRRADPMRRAFPTSNATYWVNRTDADKSDYTRQF